MKSGLTIVAPSWKRADTAFTHKYFTGVRYVVAESQAKEYQDNGLPVWVCPDSAQGSVCRVRNWILENCPTRDLLIVDDDLSSIGRYDGNVRKTLTEEEALETIEQCFLLARELKSPYWGINCIPDKGAYREYTPFSFNNFVGGPFQGFLLPEFNLRHDENLPLKEDYDLTLQAANKYRKVLRFNMLHYNVKQAENTGGCADYRTLQKEEQQFLALQRKWGTKIVRRDRGNKSGSKGKRYDINPVIRIPIAGV